MLNFKGAQMEFLGTFIITYIGSNYVSTNYSTGQIAMTQGIILGFLIYLGIKISGGHYNPTITNALYSMDKISLYNSILYQIFQQLGAILGGIVMNFQNNQTFQSVPIKQQELPYFLNMRKDTQQLGIMETMGAFFQLLVFLHFVFNKNAPKHLYGVAVGAIWVACILGMGPDLSRNGGVINPLRYLGPKIAEWLIYGKWNGELWWLYIIFPLIGGSLAVNIYLWLNFEEPTKKSEKIRNIYNSYKKNKQINSKNESSEISQSQINETPETSEDINLEKKVETKVTKKFKHRDKL